MHAQRRPSACVRLPSPSRRPSLCVRLRPPCDCGLLRCARRAAPACATAPAVQVRTPPRQTQPPSVLPAGFWGGTGLDAQAMAWRDRYDVLPLTLRRACRTASRARDFQPAVHRMQSAASLATPPEALWADLAAIPTVAAGFIVRGAAQGAPPNVLLRRNQKDLSNNEARSHLLQFSPAPAQGGFAAQPFPTELRDVGAIMPSPCGQLLALVRSRTANGKKEQSIEIWNGDMLVASVKANAEQHGDIYAGDVFASFEWSPDSSALLYVAEAPAGKTGMSLKRHPNRRIAVHRHRSNHAAMRRPRTPPGKPRTATSSWWKLVRTRIL